VSVSFISNKPYQLGVLGVKLGVLWLPREGGNSKRGTFFNDCSSLTTVTFLGDAPKEGKEVFKDTTPTIYRKPEAKGWGDTFGGRPVKLISEKP